MNDEELRRVMEIIIKRQESFTEGIERMREEARRRQAEAEECFRELGRAAVNLYNITAELAGKMAELAEAKKLLAESQTNTDQRVDALIDFVMRRLGDKDEE